MQGDYRRKMRECVRATTAAPSFFTPLVDGKMMYADGAFLANNPTSIALTEVLKAGAFLLFLLARSSGLTCGNAVPGEVFVVWRPPI